MVEHEGKSYSTQLDAASVDKAANKYFTEIYPVTYIEAFGVSAVSLDASNIIYVMPLEGLVNMWAISAGRDGRYVSITCILTAPE